MKKVMLMEKLMWMNSQLNQMVWGKYMIAFLLFTGFWLMIKTGFLPFTHTGLILKKTLGSLRPSSKKEGVTPFQAVATALSLIHIWNLLESSQPSPVFDQLSRSPFVYYVHSYYAQNYEESELLGYSRYGSLKIPGLVRKNNILGAQFHPEKSGSDGLAILAWFKEEFS